MKIGLIDADLLDGGTRFPNLALMKISSFNKAQGNDVALVLNEEDALQCDSLSVSKVFTKTKEPTWLAAFAGEVKRGGTGYFYDAAPSLDEAVEHAKPDYSLYARYVALTTQKGRWQKWLDYYDAAAIGFTSRGCFRRCPFCVNRNKSASERWSRVSEFDDKNARFIALLDDNVFACSQWQEIFEELKGANKPFTFRQGLDVRLMTSDKAQALEESRYKGEIYFAFDNIADAETVERGLKIFRENCPSKNASCYLLCGYYEQGVAAVESFFLRLKIICKYDVLPYVMRYDGLKESEFGSIWSGVAGWCNQPRQFKKKSYFETNVARSRKAVDDALKLLPSEILEEFRRKQWKN